MELFILVLSCVWLVANYSRPKPTSLKPPNPVTTHTNVIPIRRASGTF